MLDEVGVTIPFTILQSFPMSLIFPKAFIGAPSCSIYEKALMHICDINTYVLTTLKSWLGKL